MHDRLPKCDLEQLGCLLVSYCTLGCRALGKSLARHCTIQEYSFGLSLALGSSAPSTESAFRLGGSKNFTDKGECSLFKQMELPPPHVLAQLDALIVGQSIAAPSVVVEDDDDRSISSAAAFGIES